MPNDINMSLRKLSKHLEMTSRTAVKRAMCDVPSAGGRVFEARSVLEVHRLDPERAVAGQIIGRR